MKSSYKRNAHKYIQIRTQSTLKTSKRSEYGDGALISAPSIAGSHKRSVSFLGVLDVLHRVDFVNLHQKQRERKRVLLEGVRSGRVPAQLLVFLRLRVCSFLRLVRLVAAEYPH